MTPDVGLLGAGPSRAGRLGHDETVALLEVLARLVDASDLESPLERPVDASPVTPARLPSLVAAMKAVGIDSAIVHAYEQTGVLVGEGNEDLWSADELRRWEAAIEEYHRGAHRGRSS